MKKIFDLKVGWSCNNKCIHCVIEDKKEISGDTSFEDIKKIIDNHLDFDIFVITGGEPTIRKDFLDIIKYIKEDKKKGIILQTNGRKLNDFKFALATASYVDKFLIAVHSYDSMIHDIITQREGSWKETALGIRNVYNLTKDGNRGELGIQVVLNKLNSINLIKTYDFIQGLAPSSTMNLTHPHPSGASKKNFDLSVPKFSTIREEILEVIKKYKKLIHIEAIPFCYLHPYVEEVGAISWYVEDNEVSGYDKSSKNGIIDSYKSSIESELQKGPKCINCIYDDYCLGVWRDYIVGYQGELDLFPIEKGKVPTILKRLKSANK